LTDFIGSLVGDHDRKRSELVTEIRIRGLVQGVGFRPTVWRLATQLGLSGDVRNDSDGVLIRIAAETDLAERLVADVKAECPPLARIDSVEYHVAAPLSIDDVFQIAESESGVMRTEVAPDAATCPECLAEIVDPFARRYRYPFTNCTHCGPRLSIICDAPYDRARTTMAHFDLCEACKNEYEAPSDRRFHAQPIACHTCGPRVTLEKFNGGAVEFSAFSMLDDADAAAGMLLEGFIVAIKGLGGYHLACDATNAEAVERLRQRKQRYTKAFALMARDLSVIKRYGSVSSEEEKALTSSAAPIVLLDANGPLHLPDDIAPGLTTYGFMLPSTPLHHLMFRRLNGPIVMTSGNRSDEPQIIDDRVARADLSGIADFLVTHNRGIAMRLDDSVLRVTAGAPRLMRRARGFAPAPLSLPSSLCATKPLLALGGELKNTFCLIKDGHAILSQHIGDLENAQRLSEYERSLDLFQNLYGHQPQAIAVDLHQDYLSTQIGEQRARDLNLPLIHVQHHHAHIASCMAENGIEQGDGLVLGIALDGLGLGDDGTLWGGEFLLADYEAYRRVGTFKPVALPGGGKAMHEPWRNTLAHILAKMGWPAFNVNFAGTALHAYLSSKPVDTITMMIKQELNSPKASSCGRLFDAVAAAIGLCQDEIFHEGEAAMRLEALIDAQTLADVDEDLAYPFGVPRLKNSGLPYIEPLAMWQALLGDLYENTPAPVIAARFHKGLAKTIVKLAGEAVLDEEKRLTRRVVLSGGVMQNRWLTEELVRRFQAEDFDVYLQAKVPSNDGGLSLGQAAVAAALLVHGG
jgi:hydrogenase maturation protein HypF